MSSVIVYGKETGCRFCDIAKQVLTDRGVDFKFVDITANPDFLVFFKTVHETVPQIYVDGRLKKGGSEAAKDIEPEFEEDDFDW